MVLAAETGTTYPTPASAAAAHWSQSENAIWVFAKVV